MQRVLTDAAEHDADFAAALERAVQQVQDARNSTAGQATAEGAGGVAVNGTAQSGGAAAMTKQPHFIAPTDGQVMSMVAVLARTCPRAGLRRAGLLISGNDTGVRARV
ncbi:hypothetical protein ACFVFQ_06115 [Streptomyces sp. NPDC057743]|uniref:hypothetical protein n=1 Tax=Streptomyces sp. NPDC057743 TaxID=3346236 RepID=UPI003674338F